MAVFRFANGRYAGRTIDEVPVTHLLDLWRNDLLNDPGMKTALIGWASRWEMDHGLYKGRRLDEIPIKHIKWLLRDGYKKGDHDGMFLAIKYHLRVRPYECPGEKYILRFGQCRGSTLAEACEKSRSLKENPSERDYVQWLIDEGIPEKEGYEDLADGIRFGGAQQLEEYQIRHAEAFELYFPEVNAPFNNEELLGPHRGRLFCDLPESSLHWLAQFIDEHTPNFDYLKGAIEHLIEYKKLRQRITNWNWGHKCGGYECCTGYCRMVGLGLGRV